MHTLDTNHDVAVVGGGPAGSTAGAMLARSGWDVLLIERARFPRFHIGESLLPDCNEILDLLGITAAEMKRRFVPKWGATFLTGDGPVDIDFAASGVVSRPGTYQVERERFDDLLLRTAADRGVQVRQECRALEARFDPDGVELSYLDAGGATRTARARALVDASGRAGFLASRLGLRRADATLRKVAIYAHYEGVPRPAGRRGGDIRILPRSDLGWIWLIPLTGGITSVGAVVDHDVHVAAPPLPAAELLDRYLAEDAVAAGLLAEARRVSPARVEADFSYSARAYSGDRWLLTGDAGAFLDPVFSTGVLLAMQSGREAAEVLDGALREDRLSRRRFRRYDRIQRRRYDHFRRFATGFYDPAFRDILFHPSDRWGIFQAVVSVLGGNWRPSWGTRMRLAAFFALVRMQRHLPLARHTKPLPVAPGWNDGKP